MIVPDGHVDVLVVTGSIALKDTPRSCAWALGTMLLGIAARSPFAVVHGGADGGDHAAERAAMESIVPTLTFPTMDKGRAKAIWSIGLCDPPPDVVADVPLLDYDGHPLRRNDAMLTWAVAAKDAGVAVLVVALFAPWCHRYAAGRGGTRYTVDHAEGAGLAVVRKQCPAAYAPEVRR